MLTLVVRVDSVERPQRTVVRSRIQRDRKRAPRDRFGGVERLRLVGGCDDQVRQRVCLPERVVSRIGPLDQTDVGTGLMPIALIVLQLRGHIVRVLRAA